MRVIFFLIFVSIIGAIMYVRQSATFSPPPENQNENNVLTVPPNEHVTINNRTYVIYRQEISENLTLLPNFEKQLTSTEIMSRGAGSGSARDQCTYGANGGFYTPNNKPIGLFISDGVLLSPVVTNATFNGYFVKTDHFSLTLQPPTNSVEFAIQSGPYVTSQSILKIKNDTFARRVLVARSGSKWNFFAITEKDNTFSGPLMADLPQFLEELDIEEALNLDGGSASAFYSQRGVRLGELTPVGSFFCGK